MENLAFQLPTKVYYEVDSAHKIGPVVREFGSRALLISVQEEFRNPDELAILKTSLDKHTQGCIIYDDITRDPTTEELDTAAHFSKRANCDLILGYGGQESFNVAKMVAILANNDVFAVDVLRGSHAFKNTPLPVITIPSCPAMGAEIVPAFTLLDFESRNRRYYFDHRIFPGATYIDPKISLGLAPDEVVRYGVATLGVALEAILNKLSNDFTSTMALRALDLLTRNLPVVYRDVTNLQALSNIVMSSALAGMAQASTSPGISFAISVALDNLTDLDLYTAMGIILPNMMEFFLTTSAASYVPIARSLGEDTKDISIIEAAIKAVEGVRKLYLTLNFPQRLADFDISKSQLPPIAGLAAQFPFLSHAPRVLNKHEIETILIAAY